MGQIMYTAPDGDEEVVTYMGMKLFNGQPVEIDDEAVLRKAVKNPHFEVSGFEIDDEAEADKAEAPKRRGRPPKAQED